MQNQSGRSRNLKPGGCLCRGEQGSEELFCALFWVVLIFVRLGSVVGEAEVDEGSYLVEGVLETAKWSRSHSLVVFFLFRRGCPTHATFL